MTQAAKRYIVACTSVWESGEDATVTYYEVTGKHYEILKVDNGCNVFDIEYSHPWAQFKWAVIDGNDVMNEDGESAFEGDTVFEFGENASVMATFDTLADMFKAVSGCDVEFIEIRETTE